MIRSLRCVLLLCLAAVVFIFITSNLPTGNLKLWSIKAHFWNDSEPNGGWPGDSLGWKDGGYEENVSVVASGSDFLVNPGSVWPVGDKFDDRILSQLEVLETYAKCRNFTSTKVILAVGKFNFNHLGWLDGQENLFKDQCPITNCVFTSDQSQSRSADAVVISEFDWEDFKRLTPKAAHQVWVALYLEPPHQRPLNSRALGGLVNWTMSYRPDSTIVTPYGKWIRISKPNRTQTSESGYENCQQTCFNCTSLCRPNSFNMNCTDCVSVNCAQCLCVACTECTAVYCANCSGAKCANFSYLNYIQCSQLNCTRCSMMNCTGFDVRNTSTVNYAKGRTKKVATFVSSYTDRNGRRSYAWELGKYIDVDIYGDTGHSLSCPKRDKRRCFEMLSRDYKFYLSFENSNCVGYITEKLHVNALSNNVVPIVMGGRPEDYASAAPPGSYINVEDFQSPQHLAEYLNKLDANDTLYNEYFRYKDDYQYLGMLEMRPWCRLCGLLHLRDDDNYVTWYKDFDARTKAACSRSPDGRKPWKTWKNRNTETSFSKELVEVLLTMVK